MVNSFEGLPPAPQASLFAPRLRTSELWYLLGGLQSKLGDVEDVFVNTSARTANTNWYYTRVKVALELETPNTPYGVACTYELNRTMI